MLVYNVFEQVADLIAGLNPEKVLSLKANPDLQGRFEYLSNKSKNDVLESSEKDELDHFIVLERLIRLAKIRASK